MDQWFAGNFERCLDLCDQHTDPAPDTVAQITLLRARALLRLNRAAEALTVLDALAWPESGDVAVTARMLTAAALIRSDEVGRGLALLEALQEGATDAHNRVTADRFGNRHRATARVTRDGDAAVLIGSEGKFRLAECRAD